MVHHIGLYKLKPGVTPEETEEMMMNARMQLLKIDEVSEHQMRQTGRSADPVALLHRDRFRINGQVGDLS